MTRRLIVVALAALALAACTVEEARFVTGLAIEIIDYKLHDNGWR